ncbi:flagellar hook-length control protein FliK [Halarcobacter mediterraneus]|uniref:Flagellar hook-length control protein FliK n=1 Tax=Halarcobacter mediterraneus TaxID=2023153 RepID=A0A4Q1AVD6_9BACT|nr:flagellar hook-length control protein FliK [Halarcobacter mediterraneus]RXK14144.1 flagellar hook-length control protein FliK [Halarcobacter mediterraneus]
MLVSNNNLLNILLPNNNKLLKEALKEADTQTLDNLKKGDTNISDILKNLFNETKMSTKTNSSIETLLKNTTLFKDLGNFSKTIDSLLKNIQNNENLQKFKPQIENFLKNIETINSNNLKNSIENSGIFLESKLLIQNQGKTSLTNNLETILNQLKALLKESPSQENTKINNLIDKILNQNIKGLQGKEDQNLNDLKTLSTQLESLTKGLQNKQIINFEQLTNKLKPILENIQLTQSKIENSATNQIQNLNQVKREVLTQTKDILQNLKNEIILNKNIPNQDNLLKQIDTLLQSKDLVNRNFVDNKSILSNFHTNFSSTLENLVNSLKTTIEQVNIKNPNQNIIQNFNKIIEKLEHTINNFSNNFINNNLNDKQINNNPIQDDLKTVLLKVQEELSNKTDSKSLETFRQVERMITQIEYHQLLSIVSNSNNVYIPFLWDMLEDGSISMKEGKDEKFYCEINLNLKEFGDTKLFLSLFDKNKLDLTIYASKNEFKQAIRENLFKLKRALNSVELIPMSINIIDLKKEVKEEKTNIYTKNENTLGFGIDIKV